MCLDLMIDREVITNELLLRYLTGHPISLITLFMFCVGTAALLLIANNVFDQFCNCDNIHLSDDSDESSDKNAQVSQTEIAQQCKEYLQTYKSSTRGQYLWQRLNSAVGFVERTGSAAGLEDELKYLADMDHDIQQRRYSLIRIVIWATPMLGFLGTVLGISQALGGIQVGPDNDFQGMLNGLRGSLFVAFDTTALALTLSIVLMFCQFVIDRFELQLLDVVTSRTNEELLLIYNDNDFIDPQTRAVERIGRTVMATSHNLVKQQADQWQASMRSAEMAWTSSVTGVSETVRAELAESLRMANVELADSITRGIDRADESMSKRWEQWQVMLSDNARKLDDSQEQVQSQIQLLTELLSKIDSANGAQQMLDRNLDALAATSQLHTTLQDLSNSVRRMDTAQGEPKQETPHHGLKIHRPMENQEGRFPIRKTSQEPKQARRNAA